jgi:hypothetical protein
MLGRVLTLRIALHRCGVSVGLAAPVPPCPARITSMNERFRDLADTLDPKYQQLVSMIPLLAADVPAQTPTGGVYLFSENGLHVYVGRTKRSICVRVRNQFGPNPSAASFPWLIAREATGKKATYTKAGSRTELLTDVGFVAAYDAARERIRRMHLRYVHEPDPLRQALLEIYVAVAINARYNDFDTH